MEGFGFSSPTSPIHACWTDFQQCFIGTVHEAELAVNKVFLKLQILTTPLTLGRNKTEELTLVL